MTSALLITDAARPAIALLADIAVDTLFLRWDGALGPLASWHRPSRWRGLRPGQGIPDDQRVARTLCGMFIRLPFEQHTGSADAEPLAALCEQCEFEHERTTGH